MSSIIHCDSCDARYDGWDSSWFRVDVRSATSLSQREFILDVCPDCLGKFTLKQLLLKQERDQTGKLVDL